MKVCSGRKAFYDQAREEDRARSRLRAVSRTVPPNEIGRRALVKKAQDLMGKTVMAGGNKGRVSSYNKRTGTVMVDFKRTASQPFHPDAVTVIES
jgi:hypothetical protein